MSVLYRKRQNLFTKETTEWRVDDDVLSIHAPGIAERRISWHDVTYVRLAYAPTRIKHWRYVFVIELKNGQKIEIDNAHFEGVGNFTDYSAS